MRKISPKILGIVLAILSILTIGGLTAKNVIAPGEGWGTGDAGTGGGG